MKTKKVSNDIKRPAIRIDPGLDKYDDIILFPEKHAKMNEILKKTGHPENYLKKK
jgi:hypothetical protein